VTAQVVVRLGSSLSPCALALLAALTTHYPATPDELMKAVPPLDVAAWFGELDVLLQSGFATRVVRPDRYVYEPTPDGCDYLRGWLRHTSVQRNVA
jgi:hypothetical protein